MPEFPELDLYLYALSRRVSGCTLKRVGFDACRSVLEEWLHRMREEADNDFPRKVTACHDEMAVHGRYGEPWRACGKPVQRIRYVTRECNYCALCENEGRLLADRSLSGLLKKNWPRNLDELETTVNRSTGGT